MGWGPSQNKGSRQGLAAFWEYPPPMGFTHCEAQDKCYH
jgi:hypothetical protein